MATPIAYDMTRLFMGPLSRTPRGIDRVDLAYARHFFADPDRRAVAVMPTIWGVRCYRRDRVLRGLDRLEELWMERSPAPGDRAAWSRRLDALFASAPDAKSQRPRLGWLERGRRLAQLLQATGFGLGEPAARGVPAGACYVNVGQIGLTLPFVLHWLKRRPDVAATFMLHDVIPLQTPEYVTPSAVRAHGRMVAATARHAGNLIVTTDEARRAVTAELNQRGRADLRVFARALPVNEAFAPRDRAPAAQPYFVICGAIEPRKNHRLLADVWARLAARLGAAAPHLVVVGELGWTGEQIRQCLLSPLSGGRVHHVTGMPTCDLVDLLAGARALLMPSFIEGFGLPIVEAGALGVPVIASDIGAHREVAPPGTIFLDPQDAPGWEVAILSATHAAPVARAPAPQPGWGAYFEALEGFISERGAGA